jgi:hypothetical protein
LLGWCAAAGAYAGLQPRLGLALAPAAPAESQVEKLLSVFSRRPSAAAVGEAYLRQLDHTPAVDGLAKEVMDGIGLSGEALAQAEPDQLRARIRARNSADFAAGRTISVQGWVLGRTEVQLCGLAALAPAA